MKFKNYFLILLMFTFLSCSTKDESTHIPPVKSPSYPATQKKKTGTQKPYRIKGVKYTPLASASGFVQTGTASWYGRKFHGRKTSNGERYNMYAMTAAHKTLPMNTWVKVHSLSNNRRIVVRINDRGPFVYGRIIDLSYTGAKKLGFIGSGTAKVKVTALGKATSYAKKTKTPQSFKPVNYWKGNFTVQVGAFKVKDNAIKFRYKLSKTYQNAHITVFTDNRGKFYRVRIGRFTNLKDAMRFSEKIIGSEFSSAFAVAE